MGGETCSTLTQNGASACYFPRVAFFFSPFLSSFLELSTVTSRAASEASPVLTSYLARFPGGSHPFSIGLV